MTDLYNALRYILYQEIPLKKKLNSKEIDILKRFLNVIDDHFPFVDTKSHGLIKLLKNFLSTKIHQVQTSEITRLMTSLAPDAELPPEASYITCKGSKAKYRGHPCSMWVLFHSLTVGEYERASQMTISSNVHEVLYTMRDYIQSFFSCTKCAHNFALMAKGLESKLIHQNGSILWLWEAHNQVNKRLAGDLTEDPLHPKFQYPTKKMCPACSPNDSKDILRFLMDHYGKGAIISDQPLVEPGDKGLSASPEEEHQVKIRRINYFSQSDMNLGVFLYLFSIGLLLALFCFIRMRGRRRRFRKFFDLSA